MTLRHSLSVLAVDLAQMDGSFLGLYTAFVSAILELLFDGLRTY